MRRTGAPDPQSLPWKEIENLESFRSQEWTRRLLEDLTVYRPGTTQVDEERRKILVDLLKKYLEPPLGRLRSLTGALKEQLVEKDEIIDMMAVSAIAHQPMLLVGPPGTAKSRIVLRFCEGLGMTRAGSRRSGQTIFQYLLHGFTEPDEILGPVDLGSLRKRQPVFRRIRKGSIVDAEVVFLDEVFRANSAILNALLTLMNERRVLEGGDVSTARVRLIYGASNSTPPPRQMDELRAFYERFILRLESLPLPMSFEAQEPTEARRELLARGWASEVRDLRAGYRPEGAALEPISCLNDILFLNRAVTELWGGEKLGEQDKPFLREYHRLVKALSGGEDPPCSIDDRKLIRLYLVLRAYGLYQHGGPPNRDDLRVLEHTWNDLDSKGTAKKTVENFLQGEGLHATP